MSLLYIIAQIALFVHLVHGVQSSFQTLGLKNRRFGRAVWWLGFLIALAVLVGNLLIVVGVWAGWVSRNLDPKVPAGPLAEKWTRSKAIRKLISPANKAKYTIIVVGTGLASAASRRRWLELGYKVLCFCFQDSPRRAHSIAVRRGHQRRQELPQRRRLGLSPLLRHHQGATFAPRGQCSPPGGGVAQHHRPACGTGVPFAREYGGLLDTRSFGGAQLQRTFYCRGQTGQQLLLRHRRCRDIALGNVKMYPPRDARPRGD